MPELMDSGAVLLRSWGNIFLPLVLAGWIAVGDIRSRRIPNYLTLGTALSGLAFNFYFLGWSGLVNGFLGMALGFGFLIIIYVWGGMGAGDVKALSALGAWLGPARLLKLFCYMGIVGGLMALGVLWWRGLLWQTLKRGWTVMVNLILCRPHGMTTPEPPSRLTEGIPYGVAIALGMVVLAGLGG